MSFLFIGFTAIEAFVACVLMSLASLPIALSGMAQDLGYGGLFYMTLFSFIAGLICSQIQRALPEPQPSSDKSATSSEQPKQRGSARKNSSFLLEIA